HRHACCTWPANISSFTAGRCGARGAPAAATALPRRRQRHKGRGHPVPPRRDFRIKVKPPFCRSVAQLTRSRPHFLLISILETVLCRRCNAGAVPEEIMADARYYVVRDHGGWVIKFEDEHYGPYTSHDDAVRFALDGARKLGDQGERAHVCTAGE